MKKLLIAALAVGGVIALGFGPWNSASAQIPGKLTRIVCVGTIGGGNGGNAPCGGRQYAYNVKPGGAITKVEIGTENPNLSAYQNLCMPAGWSLNIVEVRRKHDPYTPHGVLTGSDGKCDYLMRFKGPALSTNFSLGFNMNWDPHDVNWKTSDGRSAAWSFPVGTGPGPVHGPAFP